MKKQDKRPEETGSQWIAAMCELLKGGILAGITAVLALLLGAVLISAGVLREHWMDGLVLAVCVLGGAVGGWFALRRLSRRGLLVGLGVGMILFLLLLTAGLLAYGNASIGQGEGSSAPACAAAGLPASCAADGPKSGAGPRADVRLPFPDKKAAFRRLFYLGIRTQIYFSVNF